MKISFRLIFVCSALFSYVNAGAQTTSFDRTRVYDVKHYIIRLGFDREKRMVFGETTVRLTPMNAPLSEVNLDAVGMEFSSVRSESEGKPVQFRTSRGQIIVKLGRSIQPGEIVGLDLKYTIRAPKRGIYFIPASSASAPVKHSAQIWTHNEPEDARYWFPSFDFPSDKATSEQFITAPKGEIAIGNGELIDSKQNSDGTTTYHYKMEQPHSTYLSSFVIGDFAKLVDRHRNVPLAFYAYREKQQIAGLAFSRTKDMMAAFESLTSVTYPFAKYDQIMVSGFQEFAGMENITATMLSDTEVLFAEVPIGRAMVEDLVSHELAHSWFGNLVTCRNWSELWLNEGFATFMEAASREKLYGRDSYIRKLQADRDQYLADDAISRRRHSLQNKLAKPDNSLFDVTTYQKGGAVLHMLRETVGDVSFWKAVNLYLERHKFDTAVSTDLLAAFEEASGQKLKWFFDQWVYAIGFPKLEIAKKYDAAAGQLKLTISQIQKADELTPAAFRFPLEIEIATPSGTVQRTLQIEQRSHEFTIPIDSVPIDVKIDKLEKVILKSLKMS